MNKTKCSRCGRPAPENTTGWLGRFDQGVLVEVACPDCQTVAAAVEAVLRANVLEHQVDAFGRLKAQPREGAH